MEQDNKKRWARVSFGASILTIIVGIILIVIRKTRSEKDDIDTTPAKREHAIGRSDRSIEELDIEPPKELPNRYLRFVSHYDNPIEFVEYALSYADTYIGLYETHWMINKVANTSTSVYDMGDIVFVTVYEYREDEEIGFETLGEGKPVFPITTPLSRYAIYKDNGDIVDNVVNIFDIVEAYDKERNEKDGTR